MLMVCKQTGCAVDVRDDLVKRFESAGYVPFDREHDGPELEPEKPKRSVKRKKTE